MAGKIIPNKKVERKCSIDGCSNKYKAKNYCEIHYWFLIRSPLIKELPSILFSIKDLKYQFNFWKRAAITADVDRCWEWQESLTSDGYGRYSAENRKHLAHRLAWQIANQKEITLCILHTCDNPPCVNPNHLYEGTHQENMGDRDDRKRTRGAVGELNSHAKLTEKKVVEIKRMLRDEVPMKIIANRYKVSVGAIYFIKSEKNWRHITLND